MRILELGFENILSYKSHTVLNFRESGVTIINGPNGAGKSSIHTVLEELLYNKNSHGLTKQELPHRYSDSPHYSGYVVFEQQGSEYRLVKTVKSTQKLQLFKNGEDISSHTATQTYQMLESIIGLDFSTFSKLVNQSMDSSLDFLSATDQKRKEFLVSLQNLERYYEVEEKIKTDRKQVEAQLTSASARVTAQSKWLAQSIDIPPVMQLLDEPTTAGIDELHEKIQNSRQEIGGLVTQLNYAESQNLRVSAHKQKVERAVAQVAQASKKATDKFVNCASSLDLTRLPQITFESGSISSRMQDLKSKHTKLKAEAAVTQCPTCKSSLDRSATVKLVNEMAQEYKELKTALEQLSGEKEELSQFKEYQDSMQERNKLQQTLDELLEESMPQLIDIDDVKKQKASLETQIASWETEISKITREVQRIRRANDEARANNVARETKLQQIDRYKLELEEASAIVEELQLDFNDLDMLQKSTKDLVGYKIESNIKVFESLINTNLQELSDGQFGIGFELDKTKLGVVVYDHGRRVSLKALSSGEKSIVHVATLLAIRDTMVHSYGEDLNLLFLDEVISVLDPEKKDTLVALLMRITNMSIFLVSHGYSNQLAKTLVVDKHPDGYSTITQE